MKATRAMAKTAPPKPRHKKAPHTSAARPVGRTAPERMFPELRRAVLALRGLKGYL